MAWHCSRYWCLALEGSRRQLLNGGLRYCTRGLAVLPRNNGVLEGENGVVKEKKGTPAGLPPKHWKYENDLDELIDLVRQRDWDETRKLNTRLQGLNLFSTLSLCAAHWSTAFPDSLACYFQALAALCTANPNQLANAKNSEAFQELRAKSVGRVDTCSTQGLVTVASSLAMLDEPIPSPLWCVVLDCLEARAAKLTAQQAAQVIWHLHAASKSGTGPEREETDQQCRRLLIGLTDLATPSLGSVDCDWLARMAYALAYSEYYPQDYWAKVTCELRQKAKSLDPHSLWLAAVALASAKIRDPVLWDGLSHVTKLSLRSYTNNQLCTLADCFGDVPEAKQSKSTVAAIGYQLESRRSWLTPPLLTKLVEAFVKVEMVPSTVYLYSLGSLVRRDTRLYTAEELVAVGRAFTSMGYRDHTFFSALATEAERRLNQFSLPLVVDLLDCFAQAGSVQKELMRKVCDRIVNTGATDMAVRLAPVCGRLREAYDPICKIWTKQLATMPFPSHERAIAIGWALCSVGDSVSADGQLLEALLRRAGQGQLCMDQADDLWMLAQIDVTVQQECKKSKNKLALDGDLKERCQIALNEWDDSACHELFDEVGSLVRHYHLPLVENYEVGNGYRLHFADLNSKRALQIYSPKSFLIGESNEIYTGRAALQLRHLQAIGWTVVPITLKLLPPSLSQEEKVKALTVALASVKKKAPTNQAPQMARNNIIKKPIAKQHW